MFNFFGSKKNDKIQFNSKPLDPKVYLATFAKIGQLGEKLYNIAHTGFGAFCRKPGLKALQENLGDVPMLINKELITSIYSYRSHGIAPQYKLNSIYNHISYHCARLDTMLDIFASYVLLYEADKATFGCAESQTIMVFLQLIQASIVYNIFKIKYTQMKSKIEDGNLSEVRIPSASEIEEEVDKYITGVCDSLEKYEYNGVRFPPALIQRVYLNLSYNKQLMVKEILLLLKKGHSYLLNSLYSSYSQILSVESRLAHFPKEVVDAFAKAYGRLLDDFYIFQPPAIEDLITRITYRQMGPITGTSEKYGLYILWGPPGSGKTTMARLLANRIGGQLAKYTLSDIQSKYHGESEKLLREALKKGFGPAEAGIPYIILFDEAEQLIQKHDSGDLGSAANQKMVNEFKAILGEVTEKKMMDEKFRFNYFVLLTTNRNPSAGNIEGAFRRRFNFVLVDGLIPLREILDAFHSVDIDVDVNSGSKETYINVLYDISNESSVSDENIKKLYKVKDKGISILATKFFKNYETIIRNVGDFHRNILPHLNQYPRSLPPKAKFSAGVLIRSLTNNIKKAVGQYSKQQDDNIHKNREKDTQFVAIMSKYCVYSAYALTLLWTRFELEDLCSLRGEPSKFFDLVSNYTHLIKNLSNEDLVITCAKFAYDVIQNIFIGDLREKAIFAPIKSKERDPPHIFTGNKGLSAQNLRNVWNKVAEEKGTHYKIVINYDNTKKLIEDLL